MMWSRWCLQELFFQHQPAHWKHYRELQLEVTYCSYAANSSHWCLQDLLQSFYPLRFFAGRYC